MIIRNERGFSLVELMLTMVIFVLVIAASSQVFTALLTQFKQQSKIGESNIEGIVGLDIFRRDLAGAGFGLPQNMNGATYSEAVNDGATGWNDVAYNDAPGNPPAALRSGLGAGLNSSDVIVIKSSNVAFSDGSQKWTYISNRGATTTIKGWSTTGDNLVASDRVIVLSPNASTKTNDLLWTATDGFYSRFDSIPLAMQPPTNSYLNFVVYGINSQADLRMPFNRADYYVKVPTTGTMPSRCAPNTGELYKGIINQSDGNHTELPLIDCIVTMKVDYWLDTNNDGLVNWPPVDDISALTDSTCAPTTDAACALRRQLKEVRIYIVAQEGQKDINYDFSQGGTVQTVTVNEYLGTQSRTLTLVNLYTVFGNTYDYKYYRWKVYTIAVQPNNLR